MKNRTIKRTIKRAIERRPTSTTAAPGRWVTYSGGAHWIENGEAVRTLHEGFVLETALTPRCFQLKAPPGLFAFKSSRTSPRATLLLTSAWPL